MKNKTLLSASLVMALATLAPPTFAHGPVFLSKEAQRIASRGPNYEARQRHAASKSKQTVSKKPSVKPRVANNRYNFLERQRAQNLNGHFEK